MDGTNGDADVTPIQPLRRSIVTSPKDEDLWDHAVKLDDRQKVDLSREAKREALLDIHVVAEKEKTSTKGRQWKLEKRSDGEPIVLRDVLGRIAGWIDSYKDVVIIP
ncbi:hypothetical protein HO173_004945 [Letharia columbiana]|uniref:Uncharacterized protein n=1 Tax=Letharia columbiana TaxID=112416 RepID=A0A8H6FXL2_9LECA|nr:uncharacterized protein HO173_004945 [Letharia columbiana]KAF6236654.1 hypothetical protein HO173_004945 [Letharia columbiana]